MRLWTLHPKYLDAKGLVALWREALLAQKVLAGDTTGYKNHPQLLRFRLQSDPLDAIASYLVEVHAEAERRSYSFNGCKIGSGRLGHKMEETSGQLLFEWGRLLNKLKERSPTSYLEQKGINQPDAHPLFTVVPGGLQDWEKR